MPRNDHHPDADPKLVAVVCTMATTDLIEHLRGLATASESWTFDCALREAAARLEIMRETP